MSMAQEEAIVNLEKLIALFHTASEQSKMVDYSKIIETLEFAAAALRPVSREQVILCKDCQYWQGNNGGYPHPECRWGNDETPDEDDYCSFAERLEVSKNG